MVAIRSVAVASAVVCLMVSGNLIAQTHASRMTAVISDSQARFEIPREFLGVIRYYVMCAISWDRSFNSWRLGDRGILITVLSDSVTAAVSTTGYRVQSMGSINVLAPLPEAGIHGHMEGQRVVIELEPSSALNSLLRVHPDSLRVDAPLWVPGSAARWIYPTYVP